MNGCLNNSIKNVLMSSWFWFVASGVWMVFLYVLSSLPQLGEMNTFYGQDKIEHIIAFGVLGFLLSRGFQPLIHRKKFQVVLLVTFIIAVYGALDELHQMYVPGRTASLTDLLADIVGGFLAAFFVYMYQSHRMKLERFKFW